MEQRTLAPLRFVLIFYCAVFTGKGCLTCIHISHLCLHLNVVMWLVLTNYMWKAFCMLILDWYGFIHRCILCSFLTPASWTSTSMVTLRPCVNTGWTSASLSSYMIVWSRQFMPIPISCEKQICLRFLSLFLIPVSATSIHKAGVKRHWCNLFLKIIPAIIVN